MCNGYIQDVSFSGSWVRNKKELQTILSFSVILKFIQIKNLKIAKQSFDSSSVNSHLHIHKSQTKAIMKTPKTDSLALGASNS